MGLFSGSSILSGFGGKSGRPPFESLYIYGLTALIGFTAADLTITAWRPEMLPDQPPPPVTSKDKTPRIKSRSSYMAITGPSNNIFNSDGEIPPPKAHEGKEEVEQPQDGPAVKTALPMDLAGTIVHANPNKSVASVVLKTQNQTKAFRVNDSLEGMGRVIAIERRKMIFRNSANGRLEYVEIPEESAISFGSAPVKSESKENLVMKRGEFDFTLRRSDVLSHTKNLSELLSQARMVPNIIPGSGGAVEGFRFVTIQPGSVFEKLGFKPMDVIKSVNDEPVNNPMKAMELYNSLKKESRITLSVERNGREESFNYTVED